MTPEITRDDLGRFVVAGRRVYGVYRSEAMAKYRAEQVATSSRPKKSK